MSFCLQLRVLRIRGITAELCFRLSEQRLIAFEIGFRLFDLGLKRALVDREEMVALPDEIPFTEIDVDELPRHL